VRFVRVLAISVMVLSAVVTNDCIAEPLNTREALQILGVKDGRVPTPQQIQSLYFQQLQELLQNQPIRFFAAYQINKARQTLLSRFQASPTTRSIPDRFELYYFANLQLHKSPDSNELSAPPQPLSDLEQLLDSTWIHLNKNSLEEGRVGHLIEIVQNLPSVAQADHRLLAEAYALLGHFAVRHGFSETLQNLLIQDPNHNRAGRLLLMSSIPLIKPAKHYVLAGMASLQYPRFSLLAALKCLDDASCEDEAVYTLQRLLQGGKLDPRYKDRAAILLLEKNWSTELAEAHFHEALTASSTRRVFRLMQSLHDHPTHVPSLIQALRAVRNDPHTIKRWQHHPGLLSFVDKILADDAHEHQCVSAFSDNGSK
jgi:hypothetical protein